MSPTPWTKTLSDFFYQLLIPSIIELLKTLFALVVLPVLLILFFSFRFYRIPRRLWIKRFRNQREVQKLQELLPLARQYSEITNIRENILENISPGLSARSPVEFYESPPSGMNRDQFIEDQFREKRRELRKIFSEKDIKAFS